jgi:UPF0755 protein
MAKKTNDIRFRFQDKLWWWGSNILGLIASLVLIVSFILTIPFRNYRSMSVRFAVRIIFLCLLIGVLTGAYLYYIPHQSPDFGNNIKYLIVHRGDTVYDIGYNLNKMGAISSEFNFIMFSRLLGHSRRLKSGRYAIEPKASMANIFNILTEGESVPFNVTIPEGLTVTQTADLLVRQLSFDKNEFLEVCYDRALLDSLGIPSDDLEGYLFPNTYNFFYDEAPRPVVTKMINHFLASLPDSSEQKAKTLGLSFYEMVIMASLIEREATLDEERPLISAVYHSRLKKRMRLQCDPSVIYALGGLNRPLYYGDLEIDSPYNTYKYYGLPPGPICSPGKASLEAAINPADVDYLYFVAKGDGSHIFSTTNREHINAKNKIKRAKLLDTLP